MGGRFKAVSVRKLPWLTFREVTARHFGVMLVAVLVMRLAGIWVAPPQLLPLDEELME